MTLKDLSASSQPHILHVPDFDDFISPGTEKTMTFGDHWPDTSTVTPENNEVSRTSRKRPPKLSSQSGRLGEAVTYESFNHINYHQILVLTYTS